MINKPASDTPVVALRLCEIMLEAGVPPEAVQTITGGGSVVGNALASDPRVRKISFTGSRDVGEAISNAAGIKRVTMELGSNSPVIIMPDADLEKVNAALLTTGYSNAGQVCISTQRIYADRSIYSEFVDSFGDAVSKIEYGDPRSESTAMGPLVRESDAVRVEQWIQQAVTDGGRLVTGGGREGAFVEPTLLADIDPAPAVLVRRTVRAGRRRHPRSTRSTRPSTWPTGPVTVFRRRSLPRTSGTRCDLRAEVDSGNLHINFGTQWRTDLMPYGGVKDSGHGKEGPRYAVEEMTETKMVVLHL